MMNLAPDILKILQKPDARAWMGYDAYGRPLHLAIAHATTFSLLKILILTVAVVSLSIVFSFLIVGISQKFKKALLGFLQMLCAIPAILIALLLQSRQNDSQITLMGSLLISFIPHAVLYFHLFIEKTLHSQLRQSWTALGSSYWHQVKYHLLPLIRTPAEIKCRQLLIQVFIAEATVSFFTQNNHQELNSLGTLLLQSKEYGIEAPHLIYGTGVPIFCLLFFFQNIALRSRK